MPTAKRVQTRSHTVLFLWGAILLLSGLCPQLGWAQATLENPQPDSFQSGIGVISGFVCQEAHSDFVGSLSCVRIGLQKPARIGDNTPERPIPGGNYANRYERQP